MQYIGQYSYIDTIDMPLWCVKHTKPINIIFLLIFNVSVRPLACNVSVGPLACNAM